MKAAHAKLPMNYDEMIKHIGLQIDVVWKLIVCHADLTHCVVRARGDGAWSCRSDRVCPADRPWRWGQADGRS